MSTVVCVCVSVDGKCGGICEVFNDDIDGMELVVVE